jgi:hypothetical protein
MVQPRLGQAVTARPIHFQTRSNELRSRKHEATRLGAYPTGGFVVLLAGPTAASRQVVARSDKW